MHHIKPSSSSSRCTFEGVQPPLPKHGAAKFHPRNPAWGRKPTSLSEAGRASAKLIAPSEGPAVQVRGWDRIKLVVSPCQNRPIGLSAPRSVCVLIISGLNSSFGHTAAPEWSPLRRLTPSLKTPERGHSTACLWSTSYGEIISNF